MQRTNSMFFTKEIFFPAASHCGPEEKQKRKTRYREERSPINLQRCVGTNLLLQVNKTIDYREINVEETPRALQSGRQTGARAE